ncbi:protein SUPPRESSOR OF MAX2 1-like [Cynara cardunculus var. scolymus]|uniref:protein SUPPRESSOR OF MAX2 1-like n=1 Tax=Cynara cardunculus var. scolymus TaxID=59895 RepID=UPI000D62EB85|nr:protein SUPPRESSOR OF MAX2 1-like [Cynara cardunculus var. scolymus]
MRAGLSTILQTLTPDAASVLNHSIAEAGRRNHNQTTPLHVAATLLAAPTGFLRQACIRSHPNSSHPLQCRALELCFSVALERLPSATSSPAVTEPPVSNALMAALKRAQAHQRRGCPEQQQQPLLAVKVELEQLIISILDDPSVSRVMREASFSSPAVKATIEQSINNNNISGGSHLNQSSLGIGFRPSPSPTTPVPIPINRNLYLNPRLQGGNHQRNDETAVSSSSPMNLYLNPRLQQGNLSLNQSDDAKRVIEIMTKSRKRNPILVGEFEPESIKKDILRRIQTGDLEFKNAEVISIEKEFESLPDKSQIPAKIKELLESRIGGSDDDRRSIIIDLADLKWLIEQPPTAAVSDIGRESVAEMSKLLAKFTAENSKVWLIGTATCETYLRCQVYHPSMENDWDLQAVPISSRSPLSGRFGTNGILGSSVDSLNSFKNFQTTIYQRHPTCCPKCYHDYEQELAKLDESKSSLPQWLQNAKAQNGESETKMNRRSSVLNSVNDQELQKKWSDICTRIHPNHNQSLSLARMTTGFVPVVPTYKPANRRVLEAPRSPVRTELVLGPKEVVEDSPVKDLLGCISSEPRSKIEEFQKGKFVNSADADSFKKLVKGLMKAAWWQPEAASAIATTVTQFCSRGSVWLLFAGPDRVGKKKMASVLAEHVCAANPITVCLGSRRDEDETDLGFRGKMVLDRIVEAVRRNPFSVIVLSDIDEADMLVRASIKQAMERGRFTDSYGREISLGSSIFVLTGNWSTNNVDEHLIDEKRLHSAATGEWRLKLTICEKRSKRRADWLPEEKISTKQQKKAGCGLSLDLNLAVDSEEDRTDASDLTTEQGDENPHFVVKTSVPHELVGPSDAAVVFKPVQFGLIRREIEKTIKNTFLTVVEETVSIEVDEGTLDNILSGIWFGRTCLEDWAETVLVPSFHKLTEHLSSTRGNLVVRLESVRDPDQAGHGGDRLPSQINVIVDTV